MDENKKNVLEKRLQEGIKNEEFLIYLQPKFYVRNGELAGAEALVRWKKDGEILMPNAFIPVFEEYKLITKLDMYVFEQVCKFLQKCNQKKYNVVPISINESRQHLYNENHINELKETISKYNVLPHNIELEMTETTVVDNVELAKKAEENVHKLGFIVSMDDFGVGYSSFSMLKNINIDVLKIDKSFFDDILESKRGKIIIESIVNMAHRLSTKVVAEGIEQIEQVQYLKSIGCDMIQGYVFAKPMSMEEFEKKYII
ncbi:MAG: EAL domain-containing protein [Clostridia bacterium]